MKAAVRSQFGQSLEIEEIALAATDAGDVQVQLRACAICHSDIISIDGGWGGTSPALYGHEAAGVVTEIGAGVTDVRIGDHVVVTLIRSCGNCYFCSRGGELHLEMGQDPTR